MERTFTMLEAFWVQLLMQVGEAPAGGTPPGSPPDPFGALKSMLVPLMAIFGIFWLLVWWPESKKRKQRQSMIAAIKKGDSVVTTGGIVGKVWRADGPEVVLIVDKDKDVKMRFTRSAISEVLSAEAASALDSPRETVKSEGEKAKA